MRLVPISASAVLCLGLPVLWRAGCDAPTPPLHSDQEASLQTSSNAPVQATSPASSSQSASASIELRDFELRDWLAFGSGCRSRASSPGDVELQLSEDPKVRGTYRLHFTLAHYGIAPSEPLLTQFSTFARECGIRLAIYPKPGLKLIDVAGRPIYRVDKGLGPEVRLRSRLFIGDAALGVFEKLFTAKQSVLDQQEEVFWQPREDAISIFERVDCEQPKIVGLDLSVAVMRDHVGEEAVTATLNQGELDLTLRFAACSSTNKSP